MSWTYSGDPGANDKDLIRFLIGDTDSADEQLSDEEIAYLLTEYTAPKRAALEAARSLQAKYSRLCDQRTGDISISYSQRRDSYAALVRDLQRGMMGTPYAGGISAADKDSDEGDSDRVKPAFAVEMMANPGSGVEREDDV